MKKLHFLNFIIYHLFLLVKLFLLFIITNNYLPSLMIKFILELKILLKIKENCVYHADFQISISLEWIEVIL